MNRFPIIDVKRTNFSKIFHLIYQSERKDTKLSKQEIALNTNLSLPTVTQNLNILLEKNLILENGKFSSNGGRKAVAYSLNQIIHVSLGLEIYKQHCVIVMLNFIGDIINKKTLNITYQNTTLYFEKLATSIQNFIQDSNIKYESILGLGVGIQGLVSSDGQSIIFGNILNNTNLKIDILSNNLNFPCRFIHDAECVALAEQWLQPNIDNALVLSIGEHIGGAIFIDEEINSGINSRGATIEHTVFNPDGPTCYCGKKGCVEVFCSLSSLSSLSNTSIDNFFVQLKLGNPDSIKTWHQYLNYLSIAIDNFHMFLDNTIIISGNILNYLSDYDFLEIEKNVSNRSVFPESKNYIWKGQCLKDSVSIGAALLYIRSFIAETK